METGEPTISPIEDVNIIRQGRLKVGNNHEIYWVDWGNKDVEVPIFYLHGGPGGGFSERDFSRFNPKKHRVVFHDQRGSGRSTPFASTDHNTTSDLVSDIKKLMEETGFKKISLYGFSWGSTLALIYALNYPDSVDKMLIGGIFLARDVDNDYYLRGRVASHFPEVWDNFIAYVPEKYRADVAGYYKKMLTSGNTKEKNNFAREWMKYESSILRLDYVPERIEREISDFASESLAYLEAHYILNNCFIEENLILDNADKLKSINKIVIVQGRYDFICIPSAAYELHNVLAENSILHYVASGHSGSDIIQREVVKAYINILWQ